MSIIRGAQAAIYSFISCLELNKYLSRRKTRRDAKTNGERYEREWAEHGDVDCYNLHDDQLPEVLLPQNAVLRQVPDERGGTGVRIVDIQTQQPVPENLTLRTISRSDTSSTLLKKGPLPPVFTPPGTTIRQLIEHVKPLTASLNPLAITDIRRESIVEDPEGQNEWRKPPRMISSKPVNTGGKKSKKPQWKRGDIDLNCPVIPTVLSMDSARVKALQGFMQASTPIALQIKSEMGQMWEDGEEEAGILLEPASPGTAKLRMEAESPSIGSRLMVASRKAVHASGNITRMNLPSRKWLDRVSSSPSMTPKCPRPRVLRKGDLWGPLKVIDGGLSRPVFVHRPKSTASDPTPISPTAATQQAPVEQLSLQGLIEDCRISYPTTASSDSTLVQQQVDGVMLDVDITLGKQHVAHRRVLSLQEEETDVNAQVRPNVPIRSQSAPEPPMILITGTTKTLSITGTTKRRAQFVYKRPSNVRRGSRRMSPRRSFSSPVVADYILSTSADKQPINIRALHEVYNDSNGGPTKETSKVSMISQMDGVDESVPKPLRSQVITLDLATDKDQQVLVDTLTQDIQRRLAITT